MGKLAIIDLDGVVADNTARFTKAEEEKQSFRKEVDIDGVAGTTVAYELEKEATNLFWQTAFDPELVSLDTLIPGADKAIEALEKKGYHILFLTSRPESMRQATVDWFWSLSPQIVLLSEEWHDQLVMKAPPFQYTKTTVWKAGIVQTLTMLFGVSEVLIVDDEQANIDALHTGGFEDTLKLRCYTSLAEAMEALDV